MSRERSPLGEHFGDSRNARARIPQVVCLGEVLIDWVCTESGAGLAAAVEFRKAPGGAPANVAVGLARLGCPVAFLGKVSADPFGEQLLGVIAGEGVDVSGVVRDPASETRMAYIVRDTGGERHLAHFSDRACADVALTAEEVTADRLPRGFRLLYCSSLMQSRAGSARAQDRAVTLAREAGATVVYDPNYREVLWQGREDEARRVLRESIGRSDLVKLGSDELAFLAGTPDLEAGIRAILALGARLLVVTDGARGSWAAFADDSAIVHVDAHPVVPVDATGAGDGFLSALLAGALRELADGAGPEVLQHLAGAPIARILLEANAVGAMVTTRHGAMETLPTRSELDAFLAARVRGGGRPRSGSPTRGTGNPCGAGESPPR